MYTIKTKAVVAALLVVGFLGAGFLHSQDTKQPGKDDKSGDSKKIDPKDKQDKPDLKAGEDKVIYNIDGLDEVVIEGKVRKLTINSISGIAMVNCGNLEAEEIEIGSIGGAAKISLKLAKGKLKKLVIGDVNGTGQLDCSMLEVDAVQVKDVKGAAKVEFKAKGNVAVGSVSGAGKVIVTECQDFVVAAPLSGVASVEARYRGTANCEGTMTTPIKLTKIESPK